MWAARLWLCGSSLYQYIYVVWTAAYIYKYVQYIHTYIHTHVSTCIVASRRRSRVWTSRLADCADCGEMHVFEQLSLTCYIPPHLSLPMDVCMYVWMQFYVQNGREYNVFLAAVLRNKVKYTKRRRLYCIYTYILVKAYYAFALVRLVNLVEVDGALLVFCIWPYFASCNPYEIGLV